MSNINLIMRIIKYSVDLISVSYFHLHLVFSRHKNSLDFQLVLFRFLSFIERAFELQLLKVKVSFAVEAAIFWLSSFQTLSFSFVWLLTLLPLACLAML